METGCFLYLSTVSGTGTENTSKIGRISGTGTLKLADLSSVPVNCSRNLAKWRIKFLKFRKEIDFVNSSKIIFVTFWLILKIQREISPKME